MNESLELRAAVNNNLEKIYSVVDSYGVIVRSIHEWLSKLNLQTNISISRGTVEQYGKALTYLCRWIEARPPYSKLDIEQNIANLTRDDLLSWIRYMKTAWAKSRKTLRQRETAVKEFLLWLTTKEGAQRRSQMDSP